MVNAASNILVARLGRDLVTHLDGSFCRKLGAGP
jgi:hypothetical protein